MSNSAKQNIFNLRKIMREKSVEAYVIPHHDESFSEYVPKHKERLYWISGFSGSAGTLFITNKELFLFTDGRYILQAKNQTKNLNCKIMNIANCTFLNFLKNNQSKFSNIAIESKTVSLLEYKNICKSISKKIKIINNNLIDLLWQRTNCKQDISKIFFLPTKYCGESSKNKLTKTSVYLSKENADYIFSQDSESIAWLFNMRGADLPNTPLVFCSALIGKKNQKIFFENKQVPEKVKKYFPKETKIYAYSEMNEVLKKSCKNSTKIIIDQKKLSLFNFNLLKKITNNLSVKDDILLSYRSIKNPTEIKSSKLAHIYDAVSLCKFLYWYKNFSGSLSELDVVNKINSLRKQNSSFICPSFPTIAGAGKNGAIIHYQPNKNTNKIINDTDILLLDSGGQYFYGTTDVTRTITRTKYISKSIIQDYTLVLKSHIKLNLCKFPPGTPGAFLDSTARKILWDHGEDFAHSTGHGVGFCLNVHEGPFSISLRSFSPIYERMIFSNEPGIYKNGKYGIRIENLVVTKSIFIKKNKFLALDSLTLVPYEKDLINVSRLNLVEKNWLNNYHKNVMKNVSPFLNKSEKKWLKMQCKKI